MIQIGNWSFEPVSFILLVVLALLLLVLVGILLWGLWDIIRPKMREGKVIRKRFVPSYHESITRYVPVGKIIVPFFDDIYHEKEWTITIEGKFKGKIRRETYSVSRSQYIRTKRGSYVKFVK